MGINMRGGVHIVITNSCNPPTQKPPQNTCSAQSCAYSAVTLVKLA